jgi:hypothetical protein
MSEVETKARRQTETESSTLIRSPEPPPVLPSGTRRSRFHILPLVITLAVIVVAVFLGRAMWDAYIGAP